MELLNQLVNKGSGPSAWVARSGFHCTSPVPGTPYLNICILHGLKRLESGGCTQTLHRCEMWDMSSPPRPKEN